MTDQPAKSTFIMLKIARWLLAAVAGAVIALSVKYYWEAPRPVVELISVAANTPRKEPESIIIDSGTLLKVNKHPYFPNVVALTSPEKLREIIDKNEMMNLVAEGMIKKLDKLISLLRTRSGDIEIRRKEFLKEWGEGANVDLDKLVQSALFSEQSNLPERYEQHPQGSKELFIDLGNDVFVDLSELDEQAIAEDQSAVEGPLNTYHRVKRLIRQTNLLRRFWIYLEPTIAIPILESSKDLLEVKISESRSIARQLAILVDAQSPKKLIAQVLITNRGTRPLPLRGIASLQLQLPIRGNAKTTNLEAVAIDMVAESSDKSAFVVNGENTVIVSFMSVDPISVIIEKNEPLQAKSIGQPSRFSQLYQGLGLSAAIRLLEAGIPPEIAPLDISPYVPIGLGANESAYQYLRGN